MCVRERAIALPLVVHIEPLWHTPMQYLWHDDSCPCQCSWNEQHMCESCHTWRSHVTHDTPLCSICDMMTHSYVCGMTRSQSERVCVRVDVWEWICESGCVQESVVCMCVSVSTGLYVCVCERERVRNRSFPCCVCIGLFCVYTGLFCVWIGLFCVYTGHITHSNLLCIGEWGMSSNIK